MRAYVSDTRPPADGEAAGGRSGLTQAADRVRHRCRAACPISLAVRRRVCGFRDKALHIVTNLALDPDLLEPAFRVSGEPTKKAAVTRALQEFVARREQRRVAALFGKFDWDESCRNDGCWLDRADLQGQVALRQAWLRC